MKKENFGENIADILISTYKILTLKKIQYFCSFLYKNGKSEKVTFLHISP